MGRAGGRGSTSRGHPKEGFGNLGFQTILSCLSDRSERHSPAGETSPSPVPPTGENTGPMSPTSPVRWSWGAKRDREDRGHRPLRSGCRSVQTGAHCAPLRWERTRARRKIPGYHQPRRAEGKKRNKSPPPAQRQRKGSGLSPKWAAPVGGAAPPEGAKRKALETLVSKRRFAYFADAGKVGRPQAKQPHPPSPVKFLTPNS